MENDGIMFIPHPNQDPKIERTALAIIVSVGIIALGLSVWKSDRMIL